MSSIRERPERGPSRTKVTLGVLATGLALGITYLAGNYFGYRKALLDECVSRNMERTSVEYSGRERGLRHPCEVEDVRNTSPLCEDFRSTLSELCENNPNYLYPLSDDVRQRLD